MKIEHKTFAMQFKAVEKTGEFAGYLSVFGNMDSYRDIVMPGAFAETLAEWNSKGRLPPILWQHRGAEPIGPFTKMQEDQTGLYVEGRLLIEDLQRAKEAHALMTHKVVSGMSIGFETIGEEWDKNERVRKLTKVKLWEGSIVTFPANEEAQIQVVKSALARGALPSLSDFEAVLRDAGFSRKQAKTIVGHGYAHLLQRDVESADEDAQLKAAIAALKTITV